MDPFEKAIRNAFGKGDSQDRAFREKVYRSAFAALDKALKANPQTTVETAMRRRQALSAKISEIESEFIPAVPAVDPDVAGGTASAAPPVANGGNGSRAQSPRREPVFEPRMERDDWSGARGAREVEAPAGEYRKPRRRGRPYVMGFIAVTALCLLAIGAWWSIGSGIFQSQAQRDRSVPNPPQELGGEDYQPETSSEPLAPGRAEQLENWIPVFQPSDPTTVTAPGGSTAEAMEEDGQQFIRIRSGTSGAAVLFDVGQGVLEQIAGRRAVFNIVASAEDGQETQISVECNLGELGDCGRKRYAVGATREDFLFEMDLPDANPGASGAIAIRSDIENGNKAVDIYEIRVSPAN
ncbi:hypothetical protein [Aquamicrobium sp. LC103]|uniref:hypothetical protein n=1 Tax=Aquamicrobium sp. LC103 TaxID=1120658 RepID=UPI00063E816F|nr:hypothetical protein [Aquamicrobium sp. LC103]TKT74243.1 hypothetical protein XW59_024860 [Aquamicrobium sp. LC103]